ncbi:MAG: hypothetical protein MJ168_10910 [Clostridia bacterium]|nr:hypothetical protein [Clostridia bacterium]
MKITVILILISIFFILFAIGAFYVAMKEHAALKKAEDENKKQKQQAAENAEIISKANQTKADARTGNHNSDFNFIAGKLHDYANR